MHGLKAPLDDEMLQSRCPIASSERIANERRSQKLSQKDIQLGKSQNGCQMRVVAVRVW